MDLTTRAVVVRMKRFKGEAGSEFEKIDYLKIFVEESFKAENPDARGKATIEYDAGAASDYDKYKSLVLPSLCDLTVESVTGNGRTSKLVVRKIHPVPVAVGKAA